MTVQDNSSDLILAMARRNKILGIKVYLPSHQRNRQVMVLMKQGNWLNRINALIATKHTKLHHALKSFLVQKSFSFTKKYIDKRDS